MPFIPTADEWLTLSAQLLEARPSTASRPPHTSEHAPLDQPLTRIFSQTRVTTKYHIASSSKARKASRWRTGAARDDADTPMTDAKSPRAKLILKTFCPHSGVCLKYKTCKAAEVSRLVQMLGSLGRGMSGMSAKALPVAAAAGADEEGTATPPVVATPAAGAPAAAAGGGDAGGKGKKKKKGKR